MKSLIKSNCIVSDFYCTQCGQKTLPIYRKKGYKRQKGHLKKLFCLFCQKEVNCVEINPNNYTYTYEDFLLEFNNHNFNTNGTRKIEWSKFHNIKEN